MKKQVKFYWWRSYKVWDVTGKSIDEIIEKCDKMCEKYRALHYEIL